MKTYLQQIIDGDLSCLNNEELGLCFNLMKHTGNVDVYAVIPILSARWKHADERYTKWNPVKNTHVNIYPCGKCEAPWEGSGLEKRQELCKFLLRNYDLFERMVNAGDEEFRQELKKVKQ